MDSKNFCDKLLRALFKSKSCFCLLNTVVLQLDVFKRRKTLKFFAPTKETATTFHCPHKLNFIMFRVMFMFKVCVCKLKNSTRPCCCCVHARVLTFHIRVIDFDIKQLTPMTYHHHVSILFCPPFKRTTQLLVVSHSCCCLMWIYHHHHHIGVFPMI